MKRRALILSAFALAAIACNNDPKGAPTAATTSSATAAAQSPLKAGDAAPDITVKLHDGKDIKLSSLTGKMVLVYFYPKDDTPGCTTEACSFRDSYDAFKEAGAEVVGVSSDSSEKHASFADKHGLRLADIVEMPANNLILVFQKS